MFSSCVKYSWMIICFLISDFLGISGSRFAEGNLSWGVPSLLFLSPGLLPLSPRPQHPLPRAPLGRPGVLWGQPGAPQTPPLGALIQRAVISHWGVRGTSNWQEGTALWWIDAPSGEAATVPASFTSHQKPNEILIKLQSLIILRLGLCFDLDWKLGQGPKVKNYRKNNMFKIALNAK